MTSEEIKNRLWNGAETLRGSMDASRYKDYMLGLMFYKFLSDKTLDTFRSLSGMKNATERELIESYGQAVKEFGDKLTDSVQKVRG